MISVFDEYPTLESERLVLRKLRSCDANALGMMARSENVYRYLPTFLLEQSCPDIHEAIRRINGPAFEQKESLILGVFAKDGMTFCGLAEFYGYKPALHKVSIGCRLCEFCWGQGIATEVIGLLVDYLYTQTDTQLITASTMVQNFGSARALRKNGFSLAAAASREDWGYPEPSVVDKWFR